MLKVYKDLRGFKNCHFKQSASFNETDAKQESIPATA